MSWSVEYLNEVVEREIDDLPLDMRARLVRIAQLIISNGLENVGMPYIRHLQDRLWEMRMKGRDGIARAIYITATGRRIVIVRAFIKKTQKTPVSEIRLAMSRMKGIK
jgi:phage-related protein